MEIVSVRMLRGPNIHSHEPCCLAILDGGGDDDPGPTRRAEQGARSDALDATLRRECSAAGVPLDLADRVRDAGEPAAAVAALTLALQCLAGSRVDFARCEAVRGTAQRRVVCAYAHEAVVEDALALAVGAVGALAGAPAVDLGAGIARLRATARRLAVGPRLRAVLAAAQRRDLPVLRLDEADDVFQLGWGRRQVRLRAAAVEAGEDDAALERAGRIPVIAVTGTNGKTTTTLLISHGLRGAGSTIGTTTTEGIFVDDRAIEQGDCTGYWSARRLLSSPDVDVAVLETARGGILKRGLAFDRCAVAVVVNVAADHLGLDGIDTLAELAHVKGLLARVAASAVVLNADDARCVAMAETLRPGCRVVYFSMRGDNAVVTAHLRRGGAATYLEGGRLWRDDAGTRRALLAAAELPVALHGHARHNIANALAAAAALGCLGVAAERVAERLASFVSDARSNPLRMNRFEVAGVTVVLDYAHNLAAYQALAATAASLVAGRKARRVAVVTAPGDRRSSDLFAIGAACGAGFDEVVVYEVDPRGRAHGATTEAIVAGARTTAPSGSVHAEPDIRAALSIGLDRCAAGDLLVFTCAGPFDALVEVAAARDPAAGERIAAEVGAVARPADAVAAR